MSWTSSNPVTMTDVLKTMEDTRMRHKLYAFLVRLDKRFVPYKIGYDFDMRIT